MAGRTDQDWPFPLNEVDPQYGQTCLPLNKQQGVARDIAAVIGDFYIAMLGGSSSLKPA